MRPTIFALLGSLGDYLFGARLQLEDTALNQELQRDGPIPNQAIPYDGQYRDDHFVTNDWFWEDEFQGEDGKNAEKQVR